MTLPEHLLGRRQVLTTSAGAAIVVGLGATPALGAAPAQLRSRLTLPSGVQTGDVTASSGVLWARSSSNGRLMARLRSGRLERVVRGPQATAASDFTARIDLDGLAPGRAYEADLWFEDEDGQAGEVQRARFRTAPVHPVATSFVWTGDTAGQGWGINPDLGGMTTYAAMHATDPDFFLHSGDTIYADGPIPESVVEPDGQVWRNLVIPEVTKVAEELSEFRGRHRYNLMDHNVRALYADVPVIAQWDDHETHNNWYPGQILADDRYTEKRADILSARAHQAFFEWLPIAPRQRDEFGRIYRKISHGPLLDLFILDMRTYKDPNGSDVYADPTIGMLGPAQRAWLKQELAGSRATWKVIANDLPLGLVVPDTPGTFEGVSQGDNGPPKGRELEFAEILRFAHKKSIGGLVFLTADVHYTSAHQYDPARAAIADFTPFWEFVSGPLNAGAFGPNALDTTFGPKTVFSAAPPVANTSPMDGFQFFGHVAIDGASEAMTVTLYDLDGKSLFSVQLEP